MLLSPMLYLLLHTPTLSPPHVFDSLHALELTVAGVCGSAYAGLPVSQPHGGGERDEVSERERSLVWRWRKKDVTIM